MNVIKSKSGIILGVKQELPTSVRFSQYDKPHRLNTIFDFTFCTMQDIIHWAACDRRIAWQRALRSLPTPEALEAFVEMGPTVEILASEAHLNPEKHSSKDDIIETLKAKIR